MSKADMLFTFSLINTQNIAAKLAFLDGGFQDYVEGLLRGELFGATALTEPGMGSDFLAIQSKARRVNGGWVLNGEKAWITNAHIADFFIVYAQTEKVGSTAGISEFLVRSESEGFELDAPYSLIGGDMAGAGGFRMNDLFIPDSHAFSTAGEGFKLAMSGVNRARIYVAAMCSGIVADALDCALNYGAKRQAFGKTLLEHQGLLWKLSDVSTQLAAMRALTYQAGETIEEGESAILIAAQAKKFATERVVSLIEDCMQVTGANGLRSTHGFGRQLLAAKITGYIDGTAEMMNERVKASMAHQSSLCEVSSPSGKVQ
jgi:alkylation response protein AidB-like acyl-CoA dehydrogenase